MSNTHVSANSSPNQSVSARDRVNKAVTELQWLSSVLAPNSELGHQVFGATQCEDDIKNLREDIALQKTRCEEAQTSFFEKCNTLQQQISTLTEEICTLRQERSILKQQICTFEGQISTLQQQKSASEKQNSALVQQNSVLEHKFSGLEQQTRYLFDFLKSIHSAFSSLNYQSTSDSSQIENLAPASKKRRSNSTSASASTTVETLNLGPQDPREILMRGGKRDDKATVSQPKIKLHGPRTATESRTREEEPDSGSDEAMQETSTCESSQEADVGESTRERVASLSEEARTRVWHCSICKERGHNARSCEQRVGRLV